MTWHVQSDDCHRYNIELSTLGVELTNTVFVNSTNITTNVETAALSKKRMIRHK